MNEYTDDQIENILTKYKKQRQKDKNRYLELKDNDEFKMKNRLRAKTHYDKNKDVKKEQYQDNKELLKAKASYNYYKKTERLEIMKSKFPDRYELLESHGYFKDTNPSESTSTS